MWSWRSVLWATRLQKWSALEQAILGSEFFHFSQLRCFLTIPLRNQWKKLDWISWMRFHHRLHNYSIVLQFARGVFDGVVASNFMMLVKFLQKHCTVVSDLNDKITITCYENFLKLFWSMESSVNNKREKSLLQLTWILNKTW